MPKQSDLAKVVTGEIDQAVAVLDPMWDGVPEPVEDAPTARVLPFANRFAAGRLLGRSLMHNAHTNTVVLGIAHGGLAVGDGVAQELEAKLDVWLVRKLTPPQDPSIVLGAISEGASVVLDRDGLRRAGLTSQQIRAVVKDTAEEMVEEARRLRRGRPAVTLSGKTVIIVDDGITAGGTIAAAIDGVRRRGAVRVVVAAPIGTKTAVDALSSEANEVVVLVTPPRLRRVGAWYQDYRQISDGSVMKILAASAPS
jgi:putative phosphoribosyl transferase